MISNELAKKWEKENYETEQFFDKKGNRTRIELVKRYGICRGTRITRFIFVLNEETLYLDSFNDWGDYRSRSKKELTTTIVELVRETMKELGWA